MHVFKYSIREGTVAAKMKNQIDGNIKEQRSEKFMKKSIGKTLEVLFEEKQENGYTEGHTTNYIVIEAEGENLENTIQKVKIDTIEGNILRGKIL